MSGLSLLNVTAGFTAESIKEGFKLESFVKYIPEAGMELVGIALPGVGVPVNSVKTLYYTKEEVSLAWDIATAPVGGLP